MLVFRAVYLFLVLTASAVSLSGAEKMEEKPQSPEIKMIVPPGALLGSTNLARIRGLALTNATQVRLKLGTNEVSVRIKSKNKADPPKPFEAKEVGDTDVEVEFILPGQTTNSEALVSLVSTNSETKTLPILLVSRNNFIVEKEQNGGFKTAQKIKMPQIVQGQISSQNDVDVYQFEAVKGDRLRFEVIARKYNSPLDSSLTLFDSAGNILAQNDDARDRDSRITFVCKQDGKYFVSVSDANDSGSLLHYYYLKTSKE